MSRIGIASFITGFGTGYMNAKDKQTERDRQAKLDQIVLDQADRAKADAARQDAERSALSQAAAPVVPQAGTQVTDAGGNQNFSASNQNAQWLQQQAQQEAALSGSAAPTAGQTALRYGVTDAMGKPMIADQAAAQTAADAANNPQARLDRVSNVLMGYDPGKAMALQQQNVQTQAAQQQLDLSKKSEKEKDAYRQMVSTVANGTPTDIENALNKGYADGNTYKVQGDDQSGWIVSSYGQDGKPLGNQAFKSRMDMAGVALAQFDPTKWIGMQADKARAEQEQKNSDRSFDLQKTQGDRSYSLQAGAQARASRDFNYAQQRALYKQKTLRAAYLKLHPNASLEEADAAALGALKLAPDGADTGIATTYSPDAVGVGGTLVQKDKTGHATVIKLGPDGNPRQTMRFGPDGSVQTTTPPLSAPPKNRRAGQIYNTPKGPMVWTGTMWVPPKQQ